MCKTLPCPFCGSQPQRKREDLSEHFGYAAQVSYICKGCGVTKSARGDTTKPGYADNSNVEEDALNNWNSRVIQKGYTLVPEECPDCLILPVDFMKSGISKMYKSLLDAAQEPK